MTQLVPGMTIEQLQKLQREVETRIAQEHETQRQTAKTHLEAEAKKLGYTIPDLFGLRAKTKGKRVAAKWQHPDNPELTWTGRGKKPTWVVELQAKGTPLKAL